MASIATLPVKTLVQVLKHLKGGEIGFDPYRDPRTSKKESLLAYIIKEHTNEQIISAINSVEELNAAAATEIPTEKTPSVEVTIDEATNFSESQLKKIPEALNMPTLAFTKYYVRYKNTNAVECLQVCASERDADMFIKLNPHHHYLGKYNEDQYAAFKAKTTAKQANFEIATKKLEKRKGSEFIQLTPTFTQQTTEAHQLATLLASMTAKAGLDEKRVKDLISAQAFEDDWVTRTEMKEMLGERIEPTRVELYNPTTQEVTSLGVQHHKFPLLLKACQARLRDGHRLNVWLKGPAGSGKTTACEKVAEALKLPFSFNGAIESKYDLIGFIDAGGKYHGSAFRNAFENGGVHLFDEFDASAPAAVNCFNAATANGIMSFPDKIVKRHTDCVLIAGANTAGVGANSDYVGRFKQDAAALDRYVFIDWPIDEALEKALCSNSAWVRSVQKTRKRVSERGIKNHMITPRATLYGAALLAAGLDLADVEALTLRKGLTDEVWGQIQ